MVDRSDASVHALRCFDQEKTRARQRLFAAPFQAHGLIDLPIHRAHSAGADRS
jgi:hypothetical protein